MVKKNVYFVIKNLRFVNIYRLMTDCPYMYMLSNLHNYKLMLLEKNSFLFCCSEANTSKNF